MKKQLTSFGALLVEVGICFAIIHWIWGDEMLYFFVPASVIALLFRITLLLETIVDRESESKG